MSNWLLFVVSSLIWGTTWVTIKFQLGVVAPEVSVAYRFGLAALVLFAWCKLRGIPLRFDARAHASLALLGLLQYAASYVLLYMSEAFLTSGVAAVLFALVLVWNIVGARIFFNRPLPLLVAAGAVVGIAGVTLVFWPEVSQLGVAGQTGGVVLAVLATLTASAGNLWSERVYAQKVGVASSTAWAILYASFGVALYCLLRGIPFAFDLSPAYLVSLAYLALFGSVVAFIAWLTLLRRVGAGRASYTAVVIPVLAMAVSTVFEGYRWSAMALWGMALVLAGNVMVLRSKARPPSPRKSDTAKAVVSSPSP
ncbi:MAG: EamA family transporter [Myxococcota bacterium]|nr:EamA family transporter [Myxococcota bacterium]